MAAPIAWSTMDSARITVLVVATILTLGGGVFVAYRELTAPNRRRVGVVRDVVEVMVPVVGLLGLIVTVWSIV